MKKMMIAIAAVMLLTSAYYQKAKINPGGNWTFKTNHCLANKFIHHFYSFTAFDTTQKPEPKFIIDFFDKESVASGTFKLVAGRPTAADQVDIGVGWLNKGVLTFYSSTGGKGNETVTVTVKDGIVTVSGAGIELANQKNKDDKSALTFNITIL
jgi:hypothetical protein